MNQNFSQIIAVTRCMKSVCIRSFSDLLFSGIRTEYGKIWSISTYSVQMRENMDQKNSEYGYFSRSDMLLIASYSLLHDIELSFLSNEVR